MIPIPPKRLRLSDVPRYIRTQYGHEVTRMTVYNWTKTGRGGAILRTMPGTIVNKQGGPHVKTITTTEWVNEFLKQATEFQ